MCFACVFACKLNVKDPCGVENGTFCPQAAHSQLGAALTLCC